MWGCKYFATRSWWRSGRGSEVATRDLCKLQARSLLGQRMSCRGL